MSDLTPTRRLEFAKAAFDHAYAMASAIEAIGHDWDSEYVRKEIRQTLTDLDSAAEVELKYELGLRIHALSAFYLGKLLNENEVATESNAIVGDPK